MGWFYVKCFLPELVFKFLDFDVLVAIQLNHGVDLPGLVLGQGVPHQDQVPHLEVHLWCFFLAPFAVVLLQGGVIGVPVGLDLRGHLGVGDVNRGVVHRLPPEQQLLGGLAVVPDPCVDEVGDLHQVQLGQGAAASLEPQDLLLELTDLVLTDRVLVDVVGGAQLPGDVVPRPDRVPFLRLELQALVTRERCQT